MHIQQRVRKRLSHAMGNANQGKHNIKQKRKRNNREVGTFSYSIVIFYIIIFFSDLKRNFDHVFDRSFIHKYGTYFYDIFKMQFFFNFQLTRTIM